MSRPLIIIGAGQTAAQAVTTLRSKGFDRPIVVFGDEAHPPYQRPPLSKAFLSGETTAERLELKGTHFYEQHNVDLRLGTRVVRLDPRERTVELSSGTSVAYESVLIATGARARRIPIPGADLQGVHSIRGIDDAQHLREALQPGARLIIIGGGYIGLEVAAKARKLGAVVTVVESQERVLARCVATPLSEFLTAQHRAEGIEILTGAGVEGIEGNVSAEAVRLADGRRLDADAVLIAVGAVPNQELAAEAGISATNGILVDAATRTAAPGVYAAGDVALVPSARYGQLVRLESVQNAIDQAKAAATSMLGEPTHYDPVPWFWSDQYDLKLQIVGLSAGHDRTELDGEPEERRFSLRYFRDGRLIAVDSINDPRSHMLARRALAEPQGGKAES
jgi:3-phenylpropionate/trans-cinnamate dioxygenase ferredoxin reductase subunit